MLWYHRVVWLGRSRVLLFEFDCDANVEWFSFLKATEVEGLQLAADFQNSQLYEQELRWMY
jgi:hypothetical protein